MSLSEPLTPGEGDRRGDVAGVSLDLKQGRLGAGPPLGSEGKDWGHWADPRRETRSHRDRRKLLGRHAAGRVEWVEAELRDPHPLAWPDPSHRGVSGHRASAPVHTYLLTRPRSGRRRQRPGATWQLRCGGQGGQDLGEGQGVCWAVTPEAPGLKFAAPVGSSLQPPLHLCWFCVETLTLEPTPPPTPFLGRDPSVHLQAPAGCP